MRGKEFKAFVAQIPDDAVIEVNGLDATYRTEWKPLDKNWIRAVLMPAAVEHNALENIRD